MIHGLCVPLTAAPDNRQFHPTPASTLGSTGDIDVATLG
jgi:hypothetical protein